MLHITRQTPIKRVSIPPREGQSQEPDTRCWCRRIGQTSPGGRQGTAITTKEGLSPGLVQKETKAKGAGQGPGPELDGKSPVGLGQALQEGLNHPECSGL